MIEQFFLEGEGKVQGREREPKLIEGKRTESVKESEEGTI